MRYEVDIIRDLAGGKAKPWSIRQSGKAEPWAIADDPEQAIRLVNKHLDETRAFRDLAEIEISVTIHPDPRPLLRWEVEKKRHGVKQLSWKFTVDARTRREATEIVYLQAVAEFGVLASVSTGSVSLAVPAEERNRKGESYKTTHHYSWDVAGGGRPIE